MWIGLLCDINIIYCIRYWYKDNAPNFALSKWGCVPSMIIQRLELWHSKWKGRDSSFPLQYSRDILTTDHMFHEHTNSGGQNSIGCLLIYFSYQRMPKTKYWSSSEEPTHKLYITNCLMLPEELIMTMNCQALFVFIVTNWYHIRLFACISGLGLSH